MKWSGEARIAKTVLFAAFNSNYSLANEKVARMVKTYPDKFYGYAFVHTQRGS